MNKTVIALAAISGLLNGLSAGRQRRFENQLKVKELAKKDDEDKQKSITEAMKNFNYLNTMPDTQSKTNFMNLISASSGIGFKPGSFGPQKYDATPPAGPAPRFKITIPNGNGGGDGGGNSGGGVVTDY